MKKHKAENISKCVPKVRLQNMVNASKDGVLTWIEMGANLRHHGGNENKAFAVPAAGSI